MKLGLFIHHVLSNDTELINLLGGVKIHPVRLPQDENYPAIVYSIISKSGTDTKDGPGGLDNTRIQIDAHAATYTKITDISERVRELLDGVSSVFENTVIQYVKFLNATDFYNDDRELYQQSLDFNFRHGAYGALFVPPVVGPPVSYATVVQKFPGQTGGELIVTAGSLPTTDIDKRLIVSRGGRIQIHGIDFTISGNTILWTVKNLGEDVIIYLY